MPDTDNSCIFMCNSTGTNHTNMIQNVLSFCFNGLSRWVPQVWYGILEHPTRHSIGHFGDRVPIVKQRIKEHTESLSRHLSIVVCRQYHNSPLTLYFFHPTVSALQDNTTAKKKIIVISLLLLSSVCPTHFYARTPGWDCFYGHNALPVGQPTALKHFTCTT